MGKQSLAQTVDDTTDQQNNLLLPENKVCVFAPNIINWGLKSGEL